MNETATSDRKWSFRLGSLIAALLLVAATVALVHGPVLESQGLSLDDPMFVTYNPLVTNPGWESTRRFFTEVLRPSSVAGYYLPLSMTSLMLDHARAGGRDDLRPFHETSLVLHVLVSLTLMLLLFRLFGNPPVAAIVALLYGLHPLTVEPTAWIGERKTLLATLFAFVAVLAWIEDQRRPRAPWRAASVLAYLLALLSKPTVMLLPLLFVLLAWWPLRRMERRTVFRMWPHFALSLVFGVITVLSHESTAGFMPHSNEDALPSPLRVCFLVAFYLGKIVRPDPLSCVYPPPPSSPSHPAVLGGVALVGALTIALLALARRARGPLVGWLIFLIALAPTLGVVRYSWVSASDKYLYFPALGLLIVLAWGLARAWASPRRWARGATLMLVLPLLLLEARGVRATLRHWTDSLTLFRQMERVAPRSPVVHAQLGVLLERQGRREEGLVHLHRALKLAPEFPAAHFNLGVVLAREGRLEESIRRFRAAEALSPGSPLTLFNIGLSLRMLGRLDSAEVAFRSALQGKPDYLEALDELGSLLMNRGRPGEAIVELRRAVMLVSGDAARHYRLAAALLIDGGGMEAVRHLREAIRLQPAWPEPLNTLAWLRATSADPALRDTSEALRFAGEALRATRGGDPRVLDTMAAAEASAGRFAAAARRERTAIELAAGSFPDSLVRGMRERLSRYERGEPYREERRTNPPAVRGTR